MAKNSHWTREQLLLALRLYVRLPFGQLHQRNPAVIKFANHIGRTPSAVAMKACNFASLDHTFLASGRRGLSAASIADRQIWEEFKNNPEGIAAEAEGIASNQATADGESPSSIPKQPGGETEVERSIRARRVQSFFRAAVLASYENRCAITGLATPELLVASHIIPWRESTVRRADPTNGICLNALFDKAFDRGLITLDEKLRVLVSPRLQRASREMRFKCSLDEVHGKPIRPPIRFTPDPEALAHHRERALRLWINGGGESSA